MEPMHDPVVDDDVVAYLASATGAEPAAVADELERGARRRAFVVDELLEAGLRGPQLLGAVVRLTGLDERQARELVRVHLPS